jgi:hypothetical protein
MESPGDYGGIAETRSALALADWLTEEFPIATWPAVPPVPPARRRWWHWRPPRAGLVAGLMLVAGLLAGVGATYAYHELADTFAAPHTSDAQIPASPAAVVPTPTPIPSTRTIKPATSVSPKPTVAPTAPATHYVPVAPVVRFGNQNLPSAVGGFNGFQAHRVNAFGGVPARR